MWSRQFRAESGQAGREKMELDSRKKSRRGRMIRSNSFETQKIREMGRKEVGEPRSIPVSLMEAKEYKDQEILKMCRRRSMPEREKGALAWDRQLCLGQLRRTRRG